MSLYYYFAGITPFEGELEYDSIDLLRDFPPNTSPTFTIVDADSYSNNITTLPPNFLLSLTYRPHDNTVLRLLSAKQTDKLPSKGSDLKPNDVTDFSTLLLGTASLYLQPLTSSYYNLWSNITTTDLHRIVFIVTNGSLSSCLDGYYIGNNPKLALWNTSNEIGAHPVKVTFSPHLHSIRRLVSRPLYVADTDFC